METVIVTGDPGVDDYGAPLPGGGPRQVRVRTVQPLSLDELSEADRVGTVDVLRVWCEPGQTVAEGDTVTVRGLDYVVFRTPWDWSVNRRPALGRHRPSLVFDCRRGEA